MTTDQTLIHGIVATPLGPLTVVVDPATGDGGAIAGIYYCRHRPAPSPARLGEQGSHPLLTAAAGQLDQYLTGARRRFDLPLAPRGNAFDERVWAMLCGIEPGSTTSYGALARRLGSATLARRVGQAVGRNPISIVIGCHRVVGSDGSLTGYAGGLDRKRWLLEHENAQHAVPA